MITNDIIYIGVNDHSIDLFEGQYPVPNGMSYNSYLIRDTKIAVLDTVDVHFCKDWLDNLETELSGKTPDYLIVHHMEPDHSACITEFTNRYPNATIVATDKAFSMMSAFYGIDYSTRRIVVGEGDELNLGAHTLRFVMAPMVHWPEVMMSYDTLDKALFTADAFGTFGALDADVDRLEEARRYYIGIVAKYGTPVQNLLKKVSTLDIDLICPLHGPVLSDNVSAYLSKYNVWSTYTAEENGVLIAYASIYGNTKSVAIRLGELLKAQGVAVKCIDLSRTDFSTAIAQAFRYSTLVLASVTYNAGVFPCMRTFINGLIERNFQNRKVALIENGSWAPTAANVMRKMLESQKNLEYLAPIVRIKSSADTRALNDLNTLSDEIVKHL